MWNTYQLIARFSVGRLLHQNTLKIPLSLCIHFVILLPNVTCIDFLHICITTQIVHGQILTTVYIHIGFKCGPVWMMYWRLHNVTCDCNTSRLYILRCRHWKTNGIYPKMYEAIKHSSLNTITLFSYFRLGNMSRKITILTNQDYMTTRRNIHSSVTIGYICIQNPKLMHIFLYFLTNPAYTGHLKLFTVLRIVVFTQCLDYGSCFICIQLLWKTIGIWRWGDSMPHKIYHGNRIFICSV